MPVVREGTTPLGLRKENFRDEETYNELKRVLRLVETALQNVAVGVNSHELEAGVISRGERSSNPADPDEGKFVIWMSDGTGAGRDGDLMTKITFGGITRTARIKLEIVISPVHLISTSFVGVVPIGARLIEPAKSDLKIQAILGDAVISTISTRTIALSNIVSTAYIEAAVVIQAAFEFVDDADFVWVDDSKFIFFPSDIIIGGDWPISQAYVGSVVLRRRSATGAWYIRSNDITCSTVCGPGHIYPIPIHYEGPVSSTTILGDVVIHRKSSTGAWYIRTENISSTTSIEDATVTKV